MSPYGISNSAQVDMLADALRSADHNTPTAVFSFDDFYLSRDDQQKLANAYPSNPLVQHRGQPWTHDLTLADYVFGRLKAGLPVQLPKYDKSLFSGEGDRLPWSEWETVNAGQEPKIKAVILEGWCVGFRSLGADAVEQMWEQAKSRKAEKGPAYAGRLAWNRLQDLLLANDGMAHYQALFSWVASDISDKLLNVTGNSIS